MRFSAACLRKFEDVEYVELLINTVNNCIAIRHCDKDNPNAIHWGKLKEDKLAIERCGFESDGSHQLPEDTSRDCYSMKSMDLVRFIYNTCGWDKKSSYRIKGIAAPDQSMVVFDLASAFRVHERHIVG